MRVDYSETLAQDVLTYYWQSAHANGSISDWVPITEASKGRPVRFRVASSVIEASRGGTVNVLYSLKRGTQTRLSNILELYIGTPIPVAISDVVDSWGQVTDGGITFDTAVTVTGTARVAMGGELFNGDTSLGQAGADEQGIWRFPMVGLVPGLYEIKAKALYGSGALR